MVQTSYVNALHQAAVRAPKRTSFKGVQTDDPPTSLPAACTITRYHTYLENHFIEKFKFHFKSNQDPVERDEDGAESRHLRPAPVQGCAVIRPAAARAA